MCRAGEWPEGSVFANSKMGVDCSKSENGGCWRITLCDMWKRDLKSNTVKCLVQVCETAGVLEQDMNVVSGQSWSTHYQCNNFVPAQSKKLTEQQCAVLWSRVDLEPEYAAQGVCWGVGGGVRVGGWGGGQGIWEAGREESLEALQQLWDSAHTLRKLSWIWPDLFSKLFSNLKKKKKLSTLLLRWIFCRLFFCIHVVSMAL